MAAISATPMEEVTVSPRGFEGTATDCDCKGTPVTVLTGVLGAGKTTLLKYILETPHGYRVAVIQNEFSQEMGIESPLIRDAQGNAFTDIVELPNGCLCCSAKDGLISALDRLLEDRQRFDYVLVEATGLADPESICDIFWVDEELGSKVFLDGVVALVDCQNAPGMLSAHTASPSIPDRNGASALGIFAEAVKQIACADVIILNKADLVPDTSIRERLKSQIAGFNPTAHVLESTRSVVPLGSILGIRAFERSRLAASLSRLDVACCPQGVVSGHGDSHGHGHEHAHSHETVVGPTGSGLIVAPRHGVESLVLKESAAPDRYDCVKLEAWLAEILWGTTAGFVYRCKGLVRGNDNQFYAVQGVGKIFEVEAVSLSVDAVPSSKLLLIGRDLQFQALRDGWRRCIVDDTVTGSCT